MRARRRPTRLARAAGTDGDCRRRPTAVFQLRLAEHDGYAVESMPGFFFGSFWTKTDAVLVSGMHLDAAAPRGAED